MGSARLSERREKMARKRVQLTTEEVAAIMDEGYRRAIRRLPKLKVVTDPRKLTVRTSFYTEEEVRRSREANGHKS